MFSQIARLIIVVLANRECAASLRSLRRVALH